MVPAGYQSEYPYSPNGKMPGPDDSDIPDPLIWLAYVGAHTTTLRLGTGILILPQRNPVVLAKEIATLDRLTGGRVELGIGVGWLEEEFDVLGIPFADRGKRTDDHVAALRALWADGEANHSSEFTSFSGVYSRPRPAQARLPITVGGHSKVAARRAGRLGDGFFPGKGSHEELAELVAIVRSSAEEAGRDPDAIEISAGGNGALGSGALAEVEQLAALGVTRVIVPPLTFDPKAMADAYGRYGDDVIAQVADL